MPFVGLVKGPYAFRTNHEVEELLLVPLAALHEPDVVSIERREISPGQRIPIYHYRHGEHDIWGITGRLVKELIELLPVGNGVIGWGPGTSRVGSPRTPRRPAPGCLPMSRFGGKRGGGFRKCEAARSTTPDTRHIQNARSAEALVDRSHTIMAEITVLPESFDHLLGMG